MVISEFNVENESHFSEPKMGMSEHSVVGIE